MVNVSHLSSALLESTPMNTQSPFSHTAPDFSDPLGLISACHQRIRDHASLLELIIERFEKDEVDADVREAARKVHTYFNTAAKHHHQDEEKNIFPLLIRQSLKIADIIHKLKQDHQRHNELWSVIQPVLKRLPESLDDHFKQSAYEFTALQRDHAKIEDEDLFAMAKHILSSEQLRKIGKAMAERRGVRLPFNF